MNLNFKVQKVTYDQNLNMQKKSARESEKWQREAQDQKKKAKTINSIQKSAKSCSSWANCP